MRIEVNHIKNNIRDYWYAIVSVSPKSSYFDKILINEIIKKADIISKKVNPLAANQSNTVRIQDTVVTTLTAKAVSFSVALQTSQPKPKAPSEPVYLSRRLYLYQGLNRNEDIYEL